jgi:O-antigen/teichoic acid export membrane protein
MMGLIRLVLRNNNVLSMFGNVLSAGMAFLAFALLARSYTPTDFGRYMIFVVGGTFVEMLRFGLTRTSIVKCLASASPSRHASLEGAGYVIGLVATLSINLLLWLALFLIPSVEGSSFYLFLKWYPWLSLANLPMNSAINLVMARERFDRLLLIRFIPSIIFLTYVVANIIGLKRGIEDTIVVQIVSQLVASALCMAMGWDSVRTIAHASWQAARELLNFGKYSMGTLISTSLLKSADTFILGLIPLLGVDAVAIYSIPLKLTELLEIPLRSFAATIYPRMAKAAGLGNMQQVGGILTDYTGMLLLLFVPMLLFCEVFAYPLVLLFGGAQYVAAVPIFRLYILYGLVLPIDRLTGVALDAIGKPKVNLYKVLVMATINIVGDVAAIVLFKSLMAMAAVTILNTMVGAYVGYAVLRRHLSINGSHLLVRGWNLMAAKRRELHGYFSR